MSHVAIHGGIVTGGTVTDDKGTRPILTHLGSWRFFVDIIEADGGKISMWDGASYDEAVRQAGILTEDFGPVVDEVV